MPEISFITTCMGRLDHLRKSLPTWVAQPDCEVVVVDFSCPERSGDWVDATFPGVKVVRVTGQSHFNLSKGRNAGASVASGRWLCMVDADVMLAEDFAASVKPLLDTECFLRAEPGANKELMGTVLISRDAFKAVEGYDDVIEGWGAEDHDIYLRLQRGGQHQTTFPARLLTPIHHGDSLRTQNAAIGHRILGWNVNRLYIEGKMTLWRMMGSAPPLETRRSLYALVRRAVLENVNQQEVRVELSLGSNPRVTRANVEYNVSLVLKNPTHG